MSTEINHHDEALRFLAMTDYQGSDETTAAIVAVTHALLLLNESVAGIADRMPTGGGY